MLLQQESKALTLNVNFGVSNMKFTMGQLYGIKWLDFPQYSFSSIIGEPNMYSLVKHLAMYVYDPPTFQNSFQLLLRLLDTYASEIAKICDLKTFWPLIQLINHLFKIRQKGFLSDFEKLLYQLNYKPECPEVANFCYFGRKGVQ